MSSSEPETPRSSLASLWRDLTTAQAILLSTAAAFLLVGGMYLTSQEQSGRGQTTSAQIDYLPNPQGGIWVRTDADLYLCRAVADAPGQCFSMKTDKQAGYGELDLE